jgi:hypothetical protein
MAFAQRRLICDHWICGMSLMGHSRQFDDVRVTSAYPPVATKQPTSRQVGFVPILLKKSFGGDERNFPGPLMRFARSGTTSLLRKTTTELRIRATEHYNDGVVQTSTFARFLASFDFRLLQHYLPTADEVQNWNGRHFRQRSSSGSPRASFCEREVLYGRGRRAAARPMPIRLSR